MSSSKPCCPLCGKPMLPQFRPFCSRRCADIDLGRWLSEGYVIPGDEIRPLAGGGATADEED